MIRTIKFRNFKALREFTLHLKDFNVLVGANNAGKSTALDGLRALAGALRYARTRLPQKIRIDYKQGYVRGYHIPASIIPISMINIQTDYAPITSTIEFIQSNGNRLTLMFNEEKGCFLVLNEVEVITRTIKEFKLNYPVEIVNIPTLGPFEEEEELLSDEYFERWAYTRRSHLMFRNIWHRKSKEDFERFKLLIENSWHQMSLLKPESYSREGKTKLQMFCKEGRTDREIYWAGFGFQVWLQIVSHMLSADCANTIVIDEPDIYLHSDLQRKLYAMLRSSGKQILLATHSVEIINEAEHDEIIVIDKSKKASRRINDVAGLQDAIYSLGSTQNVHLAKLSKGKKIIFFEGQDFKLVKKLAAKTGLKELSRDMDITIIQLGGYSQWQKVDNASWTFKKILETEIEIAVLFDRDYRCEEEVLEFKASLQKTIPNTFILKKKEMENYLLSVDTLVEAVYAKAKERNPNEQKASVAKYVNALLLKLTDSNKTYIFSQLFAHKNRYSDGKTKKDLSTQVEEFTFDFENKWKDLVFRLDVISGKQLLSEINNDLQRKYSVSVSPSLLIKHLDVGKMDHDFKEILRSLNAFALKV